MRKVAICIVLLLLSLGGTLHAQNGNDSLRQAKIEELKKLRRDLYTQKLSLTKDEADKFFPIFDEYELKLREAKKEFHKKWKDKKPEDLTEEEAKQYLSDATQLRETELNLFKTYSEKLKSAIPVKKIILLPRVTKEVQRELVQKVRENRKNGGGPGWRRGGGRGMYRN